MLKYYIHIPSHLNPMYHHFNEKNWSYKIIWIIIRIRMMMCGYTCSDLASRTWSAPMTVKNMWHLHSLAYFQFVRFQKSETEREKKMETKEEGVKLQIAIRCAKALNVLSSLRNRDLKATVNADDEVHTIILSRSIESTILL